MPRSRTDLHPLATLTGLIRPYALPILLFVFLGVTAALVEGLGIGLMIPLLGESAMPAESGGPFLRVLDRMTPILPVVSRRTGIAVMIVAAILFKVVIAYLFTSLAAWIRSMVHYDVRIRLYRQLLSLSQEDLDAHPGGNLLQILSAGAVDTAFSAYMFLWLLLRIVTLLVFFALLMAIDWKLTLVVVAAMLVVFKLVQIVTAGARVARVSQHNLSASKELSQRVKETLLGVRTIRAFGQENHEIERFDAAVKASHASEVKQELWVALAHPLAEGLAAIAITGLVLLALEVNTPMSVMAVVVFILLRLQPQIQQANNQLAMIQSRSASVLAVADFLEVANKHYLSSGHRRFEAIREGVRFEQVSFAYGPGGRQILREIDLDIPRGQTIAIVGPSGAGKSTLIHLLCRLYAPTTGRVTVDGEDLAEFETASWRQHCALISQDVHIFNATVRENIAYGKLDASEAEIMAAAARAFAHEFIVQLPQGYDTPVGDRGFLLSGGQRQRLSIARAILRDPEILIMDEATNALDTISEQRIQDSIEALARNRTIVIVSHRLSSVRRADRIVVMQDGRIVEQGRFDELLRRQGPFSDLCHAHRLGFIEDISVAPEAEAVHSSG